MTTRDLTVLALPYVRHSIKGSKPVIVRSVGMPAWLVLWPAWAVLTGPVLPILVRVGIEIAIGLSAPRLLPILELGNNLASSIAEKYFPALDKMFLNEFYMLMKTSRSDMLEPVQETLSTPVGSLDYGD